MTDALVQFLRARLDEDEQTARAAAALCGCHPEAPSWEFHDGDGEDDGRIHVVGDPHPVQLGKRRRLARRWNRSYDGLFAAKHIARHDPSRVLAEVDAKRQAIDACETFLHDSEDGTDPCAATVLCALALPYADHPDYRQEWSRDS
ncbi:DUF6221 family protein [Streptomyces erythrochromogenes]|uniref:DUF6221 family protein n=1 Tax=Streptomyces erythrochromogenes TaxID=285574 RepID=UPI00362B8B4D